MRIQAKEGDPAVRHEGGPSGVFQVPLKDGAAALGSSVHQVDMAVSLFRRANAEERMLKKLNQSLAQDIDPLLRAGVSFTAEDAITAFGRVWGDLIRLIPGDPWKSSRAVIDAIRKSKIPALPRNNPE